METIWIIAIIVVCCRLFELFGKIEAAAKRVADAQEQLAEKATP